MSHHHCGCWFQIPSPHEKSYPRYEYLPQVDVNSLTTILSTTSRTTLKQTFLNPSSTDPIKEAKYSFPLYDGVSVVGFTCHIADREIHGVVKEKEDARTEYKEAVAKGKTAGLMEQLPEASDVFSTRLGNIPADGKVVVEITYLGELQHDAQVDGVRFTIPNKVTSRYGKLSSSDGTMSQASQALVRDGGVHITVDFTVDKGSAVQRVQSPTDSVVVLPGRTSTMSEDVFEPHFASASLSLSADTATRPHGRDFVILINAKEQAIPRAFLETHPTLLNQKAVMASLTPKFNLPNISPEIVFVIDQSGSMGGKIPALRSALKLFLKSLPLGVKFNLCSFGSSFKFLWDKSQTNNDSNSAEALEYASNVRSNFGGTEMYKPIEATVERRYKDLELEVLLLTDGEIWDQTSLFDLINKSVSENPIRFFSLGIGHGASHALIQGVARAGNGFAQSVSEDEEMDKKVMRMLRGALTPHITDYTAEIEYENDNSEDEFDFEMIDGSSAHSVTVTSTLVPDTDGEDVEMEDKGKQAPISLFDTSYKEPELDSIGSGAATGAKRFSHLPAMEPPKKMQAPYKIPPLFPFSRTSIYVLLSAETSHRTPKSLVIKGTSNHGPLTLNIPIQDIGGGETIHQLAARKIGVELEEGRGWIFDAKDKAGKLIKDSHEGKWDLIVAREAIRIGLRYQVAGKWCSFVAIEGDKEMSNRGRPDKDKEAHYPIEVSASAGSARRSARSGARLCSFGGGAGPTRSGGGEPNHMTLCATPIGASAAPQMQMMQMSAPQAPAGGAYARKACRPGGDYRASESSPAGLRGSFGSAKKKRTMRGSRDYDRTDDFIASDEVTQSTVHKIISLQLFNGSWDWSDELAALIEIDEQTLVGALPVSGIVDGDLGKDFSGPTMGVLRTTLGVLAFLNAKAMDEVDIWSLVADKAVGWVKEKLDEVERKGHGTRKFSSDEKLVESASRRLFGDVA